MSVETSGSRLKRFETISRSSCRGELIWISYFSPGAQRSATWPTTRAIKFLEAVYARNLISLEIKQHSCFAATEIVASCSDFHKYFRIIKISLNNEKYVVIEYPVEIKYFRLET